MRNIPIRNDYDPSWDVPDDPEIDLTLDDEGNDPDACLCDAAFEVLVTHIQWGIPIFYECLACGARWHYWDEATIQPARYQFIEALIAQRRKIK